MVLGTRHLLFAFVTALAVGGPACAEIVKKPVTSVSAADGRFTGYSAALPLDLSTDTESVNLTVRSSGMIDSPTYDVDLNLLRKPDEAKVGQRSMAVGASWNEHEARLRSSMSKAFGFGMLPKSNFVSVSMDMNASQPMTVPGAIPVTRANIRSSLTLDGKPVGSIAFGGGSTGEEGVDLALNRPFDIPAEFTFSVRGTNAGSEAWRVQDARAMVKLLKTSW